MRTTSLISITLLSAALLVACSSKKDAPAPKNPEASEISPAKTQKDQQARQDKLVQKTANPLGKCVKIEKSEYDAYKLPEDSSSVNKLVVKFKKTGDEGVTINMGGDVLISFGLKSGEMTVFKVGGDEVYLKAKEDSRVELQKTGNITCK